MSAQVVACLVALLLHGSGVSSAGYYTYFMLLAFILMPLATGLITIWTLASNLAKIMSYSTFAGFSYAIGFLGPQSAM